MPLLSGDEIYRLINLAGESVHEQLRGVLDIIGISYVTSIPDNTSGQNGDVAINTSTGDVYTRTGGVWVSGVRLATHADLTAISNLLQGLINGIRELPAYPAEGARDGLILKFLGDIIGWRPDATGSGGGSGITSQLQAESSPIGTWGYESGSGNPSLQAFKASDNSVNVSTVDTSNTIKRTELEVLAAGEGLLVGSHIFIVTGHSTASSVVNYAGYWDGGDAPTLSGNVAISRIPRRINWGGLTRYADIVGTPDPVTPTAGELKLDAVAVNTASTSMTFRTPGQFSIPADLPDDGRLEGAEFQFSYFAATGKQFEINPGNSDYTVRLADLSGITTLGRRADVEGTFMMFVNIGTGSGEINFTGGGVADIQPTGAVIEPGDAAFATISPHSSTRYRLVVAPFASPGTASPGDAFTLRKGSGVPPNTLGNDLDVYLDTVTGTWYQRTSGSYAVLIDTASQGELDSHTAQDGAHQDTPRRVEHPPIRLPRNALRVVTQNSNLVPASQVHSFTPLEVTSGGVDYYGAVLVAFAGGPPQMATGLTSIFSTTRIGGIFQAGLSGDPKLIMPLNVLNAGSITAGTTRLHLHFPGLSDRVMTIRASTFPDGTSAKAVAGTSYQIYEPVEDSGWFALFASAVDNGDDISFALEETVSSSRRWLGISGWTAGLTADAGLYIGDSSNRPILFNKELVALIQALSTADKTLIRNAISAAASGHSHSGGTSAPDASISTKGLIEIATQAEANALTDTLRALTPGRLPIASTSQEGVIEIASTSEVNAKSAADKALTPSHIDTILAGVSSSGGGSATLLASSSGTGTITLTGGNQFSSWNVLLYSVRDGNNTGAGIIATSIWATSSRSASIYVSSGRSTASYVNNTSFSVGGNPNVDEVRMYGLS